MLDFARSPAVDFPARPFQALLRRDTRNRYALFAKKADGEGFPQVAKLFRAAAAAEAIHRETHKAAIVELGGRIENFQLAEVVPASTAENLRAAIKGETYERDTMYPEFLKAAKADEATAAIRSFTFAVTAEKEHAKLYQQALDQLGKNPPADYFVCQVCGMTLTALPAKRCPSCRASRDEYKQIT
ncbi:MAG: rubrerythrin family protein [Terrimicrobiaceae bacterium]|nr:rubrerythrin family protein [Terrimicrobiaceae bacterium]